MWFFQEKKYDNHFEKFTLSHNYFTKPIEISHEKVVYYTYGLICMHIFALANANQEKDLEKFVINNR